MLKCFHNDSYFFYRYIRLSPERFDHMLGLVENSITKEDTNFRKAISAGERLAVTLRFLASLESQRSLSFAYLIGKSTLSHVIRETCDAILEALAGEYLRPPSSTELYPILLVTSKRHGIYPMLCAQLMANILEFIVQNRVESFFIIIKDSSVLYC